MNLCSCASSNRRSQRLLMKLTLVSMNWMAKIRCSSSIGLIGRWGQCAPFAKVKTNLWRLYNLANAYAKKPSDLFELETDIGRWSLDEACLVVGRRIENNLNNGKEEFHGFDASISKPTGGYRSAKGRITKQLRI